MLLKPLVFPGEIQRKSLGDVAALVMYKRGREKLIRYPRTRSHGGCSYQSGKDYQIPHFVNQSTPPSINGIVFSVLSWI